MSHLGLGIPDPRQWGQAVQADPQTRIFKGDGTPFLRLERELPDGRRERLVAGFTADGRPRTVREVRIDGQVMPQIEKRRYPLNAASKDPRFAAAPTEHGDGYKTVEHPVWALDAADDGVAILIRNEISNDGIWAKASTIAVTADWDVDPLPEAPEAKAKK